MGNEYRELPICRCSILIGWNDDQSDSLLYSLPPLITFHIKNVALYNVYSWIGVSFPVVYWPVSGKPLGNPHRYHIIHRSYMYLHHAYQWHLVNNIIIYCYDCHWAQNFMHAAQLTNFNPDIQIPNNNVAFTPLHSLVFYATVQVLLRCYILYSSIWKEYTLMCSC